MIDQIANFPAGIGPVVLFGGISLIFAGTTMLLYSAFLGYQGIARRVALVQPKASRPAAAAAKVSAVRETLLLSGPLSGLPEREQRQIVRLFGKLDVPPPYISSAYYFTRVLCAIVFGVAAYFLALRIPLLGGSTLLLAAVVAAVAFVGWLLPHLIVQRSARLRSKAAMEGLADALEMIVICVEVGLALEDAIDRTVKELEHSHPILAEELSMTSADLKLLPSQDMALARLANRVDEPTVRTFVTTLSQTIRLGTPLAQGLRVVASGLRNDALAEMEERANRLPTLLTLPMMFFIMPTIFLIAGGPAALRIVDTFFR